MAWKWYGKFIKKFGRKGEGPGEILGQRASFLLKDMIIICDGQKIHYFTKKGDYINSIKNNYYMQTPVVFLNENEFISAPYSTSHFPDGKGSISKINLKGNKVTVIDKYSIFKGGVVRARGAQMVWMVNEIDIFSPDGKYQYRARVEFDKRFTIPSPTYGNTIFIKNDYLYAVLEDEKDAIRIFKYKIKVPG